ncbi:MAG: hypothetical protein JST41_05660 [Bacteroidetes bacterium]|jgi:Spy/CpxP family protein refolding chaperone|nr:hypothetical protein [Bacteroidota bacterium]MBX7129470.1 DUF4890 domain-containing protein [Flavobacteriales bacterium]MCC6656401.1 hypothetical protein [Flavobacteriales bacterium]HMZ50234.1 hypothetical protein [Flavobacteriales bacterium]HNA33220.1 hypothetical protein [Flavobacteriales bacterium]
MRTILTTLALAVGMSLMAQDANAGKDKKTPEERAAKRTEQMTKDLGLSSEQVAKVNTINLNFARYSSDVEAAGKGADVEGRTKALKAKRDAELKAVLTPEQYTKYEEIRAKKQADKKSKDAGN